MNDAEELQNDPIGAPAEKPFAEEVEAVTDFPSNTADIDEPGEGLDDEPFDDTIDVAGAEDFEDASEVDAEQTAEQQDNDAAAGGTQEQNNGASNAGDTDGAKRSRFKGWKLSELAKRPEPVWILKGTIPAGLSVVYGLPKAGKSFWCIEVAACFAAGAPFHGAPLGKSGRVLYVAAEGGGKAIYNRIMSVARKRGIAETDLEPNFEIVEHAVDLNNPKSVDEFLKVNPGRWDLVIIDTLARCMSADENSTADMNMVISECDRIRRKTAGDLIVVHHQGWTKARPRGASALFGALDALIRIYRNPDRFTVVEVEALREGAVDNAGTLYRLVDGVMEPVASKPNGLDKLRDRERKMLEILETLSGASKVPVTIKEWRAAVEAVVPPILDATSKKVRDQQWRRAVATLTKVESIKVEGGGVIPWIPSSDFNEDDVGDD